MKSNFQILSHRYVIDQLRKNRVIENKYSCKLHLYLFLLLIFYSRVPILIKYSFYSLVAHVVLTILESPSNILTFLIPEFYSLKGKDSDSKLIFLLDLVDKFKIITKQNMCIEGFYVSWFIICVNYLTSSFLITFKI